VLSPTIDKPTEFTTIEPPVIVDIISSEDLGYQSKPALKS